MNLLEIRKNLVEKSGRYDLADEDWNDTGADFYINAGSRFLDRVSDFLPMSKVRRVVNVDKGEFTAYIGDCRYVEDVYAYVSKFRILPLKKISYDQIFMRFPYAEIGDIPENYPSLFCPGTFQSDSNSLFVGSDNDYDTLIILPPVQEDVKIIVHGVFYSPKLLNSHDRNFWSQNYPNILVMAAMRELEVFHRNTQGLNDWEMAITREVQQLQMDRVSEEIHGINQMEG